MSRRGRKRPEVVVRSFPIFGVADDADELICPSCGHRVDLMDPSMGAKHWFAKHADEEVPA